MAVCHPAHAGAQGFEAHEPERGFHAAEGVAQIIATYLQGLFRTALLSYDRSQLERQVDLFLTSLGL
jgi:hypothetical protein